jgi:flagellar biosynthesis chaperone FliJ
MVSKKTKLKELLKKKEEVDHKIARMKKGYRGVVHESALSELRHSEYHVYMDYVESLRKEIEELEKDIDK